MQNQAALAYNQTAKISAGPRDLEADLLLKAASRLQSLKDGWPEDRKTMRDQLRHALNYNQRLWTIFTTSATGSDNPLPDAIKQNIANLGLFIFSHTRGVLAEPAPEKLNVLISINREIAAGLRGKD